MNKKPINIAARGMDKQTLRLLGMVFNGPGKGDYAIIEQLSEAQACVFDLDCLDGTQLWKDYRTRYPQLPTIILSLEYKDIAGTFYVKKPVEVDNLLKALKKLKRVIEEQTPIRSSISKAPRQHLMTLDWQWILPLKRKKKVYINFVDTLLILIQTIRNNLKKFITIRVNICKVFLKKLF